MESSRTSRATSHAQTRAPEGTPYEKRAEASRLRFALLVVALTGLIAGGLAAAVRAEDWSHGIWRVTTVLVASHATVVAVRKLWQRHFVVDVIAVVAMFGALALREDLAAMILAVMLTGGGALEQFAIARARRELRALLERAPRVAHRREGSEIVDVAIDEVALGDVLVVKPGEVVPADGVLESTNAILDESVLSGESRPIDVETGCPLRSGAVNAGGPFEIRVVASASESTFAGIVRLVRSAETSKARFVRLADRYALVFLALTLLLVAVAWFVSGHASRALAVLVVATPCPLILAAPAAMLAGVSRAARNGILIKGGMPLETLANVSALLLDKTGTVTSARPVVVAVETLGSQSSDEVLRLAGSIERVSMHPYAPAVVAEARRRSLPLSFPTDVVENMGRGITGRIDGMVVSVGQARFVGPDAERTPAIRAIETRTAVEGSASVFVAVDGRLVGALLLQDPVRPEVSRVLRTLRAAGWKRIHMVTGDHPDVAELVGDAIGIDRVYAERTPEDKVELVHRIRAEGVTAMVGDGVNDAPALACADVGIAMGVRGASAASEAADVVLMNDRLEGLALAQRIARETRTIARQSVFVGIAASVVAMGFAAAGTITPVAGALIQEAIDVIVILNALRALGGATTAARIPHELRGTVHELTIQHDRLRPLVEELATRASQLESLPEHEVRSVLMRLGTVLEQELMPHERAEQREIYPALAHALPGEDPTGPLVQTHHEIQRLIRLFGRLVERIPEAGPAFEDLRDLRRVLYGLHAILTLHFAQEEELYSLFEG